MSAKGRFDINDIIRLNVGGQRFDTRLRTLLADRSSDLFPIFATFLEPGSTEDRLPGKDQDGAFFLDRDPEQFRNQLNNLRYLVQFQDNQKRKSFESLDDDINSNRSVGFWGRLRKK